ncbi:NAD(P)-binding protein [Polyporus arcularius HHB13444]|uniref:NAD(P)-binding protein n=1 Tax=Polyporus arcularius HHB13444 TaxID=1314778 RepID=A0A5C3PGY6_9APHY|nr:NAD(P)-binding protein [Polyporus arcularius HHB13444]
MASTSLSSWHPTDTPDLSGKVALVTGGNAGIGREIVKELLRKNARVYLAARSPHKARTHLYLNAGLMLPPAEDLTAQGYDLTFGTNVIGHFLFLQLIYPLLLAAPAPGPARIVWTASFAHYQVPGDRLNYATFTDGPERRNVSRGMFDMYAQSKLAQVALSSYLAKHAAEVGDNVASTSLEIFRGDKPWYLLLWDRFIMYPTAYGAITPLYAGTAPEALTYHGKYLRPWARPGDPNSAAL